MKKFKALGRLAAAIIISCFTLLLLAGFSPTGESAYKVGQTYSGFKLQSLQYVEDVQSNVYLFTHVKSGAKLMFMQNNDENKVFSIAFRTPAEDNTGVNHIIEHSVLDGSDKYPVKSPFLEIGKRSVNTFLNAYTSADSTVFPVASRNEKDFNNLMSIYLDGVFHPKVLTDKRIFLQEAGHYELASKDGDLSFKGVVYNEMKGNLSSPDSMLADKINESLFPDTSYKWESGGVPENIRSLTWEQLKATYKKNYQPSNSCIYLYGNVNLAKTLAFIDQNYLGSMTAQKVNQKITYQKAFTKPNVVVTDYPVDKGVDPSSKAYLAMNFVIDKTTNREDALGMMFLNYLLMGNNGSPLKSALLSSGIGSNVYGNVSIDGLQSTYSIIAENANAAQKEKFQQIISSTLTSILQSGLDKSYINGLVHSYEISFRAGRSDANRGITYNSLVDSSWVNGGDPLTYLTLNSVISKIKKEAAGNYFESLIDKYLLHNKISSLVVLNPVPGLGDKNAALEKAEMKAMKDVMLRAQKQSDIDAIIKQTADLTSWQAAPDTQENLDKLPTLEIKDIDTKSEGVPTKITTEGGIKILQHAMFTNDIVYSDLYFDTSTVPQKQLPYLYLMSGLLGGMDTKNYSYTELFNKANSCLGSLSFSPTAITKYKDMNTYYPKLDVSFYTLGSDLGDAMRLIGDIANNTKFDNLPLLQQYIKMIRSSLDSNLVNSGEEIAVNRLTSYYSEIGKYNDVSELPFYHFIVDLDDHFAERSAELVKNMEEVKALVFNKNNMTVGVTCDSGLYASFSSNLKEFAGGLSGAVLPVQKYKFDETGKNEGYLSTSQVQYIAEGYDLSKLGFAYSGKLQVLSSIVNGEYIWNKVRELGGAYGGSFDVSSSGNAEFVSWRDPNLSETLDIFAKAGDFIKNYPLKQRDLDNYIISTIGAMDKPMSPYEKGKATDLAYFKGITQKDVEKERNEILSTTINDIKGYGELLTKIAAQNTFCVFGNQTKINDNKKIFDKVINIAQ